MTNSVGSTICCAFGIAKSVMPTLTLNRLTLSGPAMVCVMACFLACSPKRVRMDVLTAVTSLPVSIAPRPRTGAGIGCPAARRAVVVAPSSPTTASMNKPFWLAGKINCGIAKAPRGRAAQRAVRLRLRQVQVGDGWTVQRRQSPLTAVSHCFHHVTSILPHSFSSFASQYTRFRFLAAAPINHNPSLRRFTAVFWLHGVWAVHFVEWGSGWTRRDFLRVGFPDLTRSCCLPKFQGFVGPDLDRLFVVELLAPTVVTPVKKVLPISRTRSSCS